MREIRLSESELFKNLTVIEDDKLYIDLHNDFECKEVKVSQNVLQLVFINSSNSLEIKSVKLIFKNASLTKISVPLQDGNFKFLTIDNIYRGRFENGSNLPDRSDNGMYYYYVDFYEDYNIELFAIEIVLLYD